MPQPGCFRDFVQEPLNARLDLRSPNGGVARNDLRLNFNFTLNEEGANCRRTGWKRLFADHPIGGDKNSDLHDQLLGCVEYYQQFDYVQSHPGGLTGYTYSRFIPAYSVSFPLGVSDYGHYCGYYPDANPNFSLNQLDMDQFVVRWAYIGYPYNPAAPDPTFPCQIDPGDYPGSYYYLRWSHQMPDIEVPALQEGLVGTYTAPYSLTYQVCGSTRYIREGCREAITLIGQVNSENDTRKLVAGTKSRLYVLNERTSNWRIIADGLGGPLNDDNCDCSSRRFIMDRMGGFAFFSNFYDPVLSWSFDAPTTGCNLWSASYIQDLLDLGITRARCICQWNGFLFVANVEQEGTLRPFRIFWSDFNKPLSFFPGAESLAGFSDLEAGESILNISRLGAGLRIFTDRNIYEVVMVGGDLTFNIRKLASGPSNMLKFAYSVANAGDTLYYLSENTVMMLRETDRAPIMVEWIHKAAGAIYNGVDANLLKGFTGLTAFGPINKDACDHAIGYYRQATDEVYFSWPTDDETCPNVSLCLNVRYGGADIIDHGFTAFTEFGPDAKQSVIEWFIDQQLCGWNSFLGDLVKEGLPYFQDFSAFPDPPPYILNATEDPDAALHADSWCSRLGSKTVEDFCQDCAAKLIFIGASAGDKCLKEFDPTIYYRERYTGTEAEASCPETSVGIYVQDGYVSLKQRDLNDYGVKADKLINRVAVDFDALPQTTPNTLYCQVGYAANASCVLWSEAVERDFACMTDQSDAEHAYYHTRPNELANFPFHRRGRYLTERVWISGTGGGGCLTKQTNRLRMAQGVWP